MDCETARTHLLDEQRGKLSGELRGELSAHLEGCAACRRVEAGERALTDLLELRLPQRPAPIALKRRLAERWLPPPGSSAAEALPRQSAQPPRRRRRALLASAAGGLALAAAMLLFYILRGPTEADLALARLSEEATNDHLRVLASDHPLEIESGGMHQVKPWFTGKLDFAPVVPFLGDDEFPLKGGAVGYFLDRKAAIFEYQRRLHTISLFVFRAGGLSFPARGAQPMGRVAARATVVRGFSVLLWRDGELGYALVSDLNPNELFQLGLKVAGGS